MNRRRQTLFGVCLPCVCMLFLVPSVAALRVARCILVWCRMCKFYLHGAMVAAHHIGKNRGTLQMGHKAIGHQEVVDAPPHVLLPCMESVAPPAVGLPHVGIEMTESVGEARSQKGGHLLALLIGETRIATVGLGVLEVYFQMRHVHVAAHDDGFSLVQPFQVGSEVLLPLHAVVESAKPVLTVGHIDIDKEEVGHFERDDSPLVVVLFHADPVGHVQGDMARVDGGAGIALFLRIVPVGVVAKEIQVELSLLQFRFLQAEKIGIQALKYLLKILSHDGSQTVHIPTDEFHVLFLYLLSECKYT